MERIIIVGVDDSETSRAALQRAAEIASALDARLHVVTSVEPATTIDFTVGADVFHSDWVGAAESMLDEATRGIGCDHVTRKVTKGDPARSLCAEAEALDAQAIVVGNRRTQGMARVLGSVAASVVKHAPCDVVVANTSRQPNDLASVETVADAVTVI